MKSRRAARIAFPAVLGALSLMLLFGAALVPAGKWGMAALAGLGPCAAVASVGVPAGLLCWGGVSLLALFLLPDKLCALLFAAFFGCYPVVKALAERLKRAAAWLAKLLFFNAACGAVLLVMERLLLLPLPAPELGVFGLWAALNVIFCVYDAGLTKLICFYLARVDRAVRNFVRR